MNAPESIHRLQQLLDRTTAAALAASSVEGPDVFAELVRGVANVLGTDAAMIAVHAQTSDPTRLWQRMRSRAAIMDGKVLATFEYDLDHSPCRGVIGRASRFMPSGANLEMAPGTIFRELKFDSFAARSLVDSRGRPLGLIAALDRAPMVDQPVTDAVLQIFAVRAAAELEREAAEQALRDSEASYRAIFEANEDAIFIHDWDTGTIVDVSPKAAEMFGYPREALRRMHVGDLSADEPPYTLAEAVARIEQAKADDAPVRFQWRGRHRDGRLMWHEITLKRAQIAGKRRVLAFVRDVTDRRLADESLQLREEQYRAIFNASADALVLWNDQLHIVDVNPAFLRIYRFARDEIVGRSYPPHLPGDYINERVDLVRRALAGERCELETRAYRADGELFDVELRVFPIRHRGAPHVLAIARDITERRRAEERLRASEERYRLLFETESDAIVLVDTETLRLVDVNRAALEMYGYTREQLLSMAATDLSMDPAGTRASIMHGRGALNIPQRLHRRRDGSVFPVEIRANRLELDGRMTVVAAIRDVTERREREEALQSSEARLRVTVDAAFDCVVGMDRAGRIIEFNPAAEQCFGLTRAQAIGAKLAEILIPPRLRAGHAAGMQRYLAQGEGAYIGRRVETTAMRVDGSEFPVELAVRAARSGNDEIFVGYMRDLTQVRRAEATRTALEAQLRQAQKMEAIGQLTGGIAHDFNNILASIMGFVGLAAERPGARDDPALAEDLQQAEQGCRRARDLIQQMLAFGRGRHAERERTELLPVVEESLRLLRATLPASTELGLSADDADATANVDPVQVQQVMLNLGINARDAIGGVGRIDVGLRRVDAHGLTCSSCGRPVSGVFHELSVQDSGPGIAAELRARIFEPFFSTKAPGRGTGMGLASVHRIAHDHGGHVVLTSDHGARFAVLLPAVAAGPQRAAGTPTSSRDRAPLRGRVLLVDDEESVLNFMRELLRTWGLEVEAVRHPRQALALLQADPGFDLLLTDQTMPGMTGLDLAHAALSYAPRTPVLLYTGYADLIDPEALRHAGVRRLLHKPVEPAELRAALTHCLATPRA